MVLEANGSPFIGYVMTGAASKNQGLARLVVDTALHSMSNAGYEQAIFYITQGNTPSERLFRSLGAREVPEP